MRRALRISPFLNQDLLKEAKAVTKNESGYFTIHLLVPEGRNAKNLSNSSLGISYLRHRSHDRSISTNI